MSTLQETIKRVQKIIKSHKPLVFPEPIAPKEDAIMKDLEHRIVQYAAQSYIARKGRKNGNITKLT